MSNQKNQTSRDITTVINKKDIHSVVRDHSDPEAFDEYRRLWQDSYLLGEVPDFPIQLDLELNYSCNFRCPMCTWSVESTQGKGKQSWFSFDVFKEVIDEGVQRGLKALRLNYINEPMIRLDLVKFIKYAKSAGVLDIYFSSNGSLLNDEISRSLITSGLTRLQISLDAVTDETFQIIRVSDFKLKEITEKILRFMQIRDEEFQTELPTMRVNFVKTELNENELEAFVEYWKDRVDGIGIQDLVNIMKPTKGEKIAGVKAFQCPQPFHKMTIRYNGHILPCCTFFGAEVPVAMLRSERYPDAHFSGITNIGLDTSPLEETKDTAKLMVRTITEAWKAPEIEYLRDIHRKGEYWRHPVCKKCVESTSHHDETI